MADLDMTPRYTPEAVMTEKGMRAVVQTIAYARDGHPEGCPLVPDCIAVELVTDIGLRRWYGVQHAIINSELRMVVTGFDARFEEMAAWAVATEEN